MSTLELKTGTKPKLALNNHVMRKPADYTLRERATIITQTPMRITLGGGGTDVLWYSRLRGGSWISAGINKYVFIFLNKTEDPELIKASHGVEATMTHDYREIPNENIREILKLTGITKGVEISTAADASARSGLGGSGAFQVGLLNALHIYKRQPISQLDLGRLAAHVEIDLLKKPVGPQDQYIAALGGINYFEIDTNGDISVEPLDLSHHSLEQLENNLLFFRTGIQRHAASVLLEGKKKMEKKESAARLTAQLDSIKDIGREAKSYLLKGKIDDFGRTLHEHWLIKRGTLKTVTNDQINDWYEEAMKAGALGGKIMGAGGGGWFVFYVNKDKEKFRRRMNAVGLEERKVRFDWEGTKTLINIS